MSVSKTTFLKIVPLMVLIGTFFIGNGFTSEHFPYLGEVSRGPVNVRAGANINFEVVDKLAKGRDLVVLAKNYEWYKVRLPDTASVFIRADYIKEVGNGLAELTSDKVNLRAKPNSNSTVLGQVNRGDILKLVEKVTGLPAVADHESNAAPVAGLPAEAGRSLAKAWWKVAAPTQASGWIHADFIAFKSAEVPEQPQYTIPPVALLPPKAVPDAVSVQGLLQPVDVAVFPNVRYQVLVDGKSVYYLHDVAHLDHFKQAMVKVEGAITGTDKSVYPILRIHKIVLVL